MKNDATEVFVDDLVQADAGYVETMRTLLKEKRLAKVQADIDTLYFHTRDKAGCAPERRKLQKKRVFKELPQDLRGALHGGGCGKVANAMIASALQDRKDLVFETTGHTYPAWLIDLARGRKYRTVLAYTLASFDTLLKRNRARMQQALIAFDGGKTTLAPRLPDLTPTVFYKRLNAVFDELLRIARKDAVGCTAEAKCVDELLVLSNEKRLVLHAHVHARRDRGAHVADAIDERRQVVKLILRLMARFA